LTGCGWLLPISALRRYVRPVARRPPDDRPPEPPIKTIKIITQLGDTEPFRVLLRDLARLHARMGTGEVTLEQATDELERIFVTLMGTTM
jgi:hypothetical protein